MQISLKGLVTVEFSQEVIVPANFTLFNAEFLRLWVVPSQWTTSEQNKGLDSWIITSFTKKQMQIQLQFVNPAIISQA